MAAIQTTFAVMPAAVYWFGGLALAHGSNAITVPTLIAFTTLQTRLFFPVGSLLNVGLEVQTSLALFDRIFEYLDQPIEIVERAEPVELATAGDVTFETSGSATPPRRVDAARRLVQRPCRDEDRARRRDRRRARRRSRTSTARLYDVERGRVAIDGVDVRDLSFASLARLVGVVSQETYLFHSSVRENLRFAKPDATDEEIEAAVAAAQISDLIASLPDGYDTVVGERGYRFSGGEKQRIAIARTFSATRRSSCSTRRRARSTPRRSGKCKRRSTGSRRAARRSRSPTGSRPSTTPTRSSSSTAARSSSAAARGALALGGRYAELVGRRTRPAPALRSLDWRRWRVRFPSPSARAGPSG